jgi:hypothetical protein
MYPRVVVMVEPRKLRMCIWSQSEVAEAKVQMRAKLAGLGNGCM